MVPAGRLGSVFDVTVTISVCPSKKWYYKMLHHVLFHQSCVGAEWTLQHSAEGSYSTGNFWFTNMNVMLNEVWFLFLCALSTWRFQKKCQKNISLLKTLNQNISDLVSVDRLVDSLLQRQLSWCVNALRQFVQDVVVLKWEGFLSSDELTAQMSVAWWRLRSLRADVGVGSRVLDSEVAGFLSEDAVINSAVVQSPWPSL